MTNAPFKNYGFVYPYDGKEFAFHVVAHSEEEAKARVAVMSKASFFGELHEDVSNKKWIVEAGKIIHIGGLPYAVTHDIIVHGFHKPEWDVPTVKEANSSSAKTDSVRGD